MPKKTAYFILNTKSIMKNSLIYLLHENQNIVTGAESWTDVRTKQIHMLEKVTNNYILSKNITLSANSIFYVFIV